MKTPNDLASLDSYSRYLCQYIGPASEYAPTCTSPALAEQHYCAEHRALVYQEGSALRPRHKDQRRAQAVRLIESLMNEAVEELEAEGFFDTVAGVEQDLV